MSARPRRGTGGALAYTIKIPGRRTLERLAGALTDHLPSGTVFLNAKATRDQCSRPKVGTSGGKVRCDLRKLKIGGVWRIHIKLTTKTSHGTARDKARSPAPPPTREKQ